MKKINIEHFDISETNSLLFIQNELNLNILSKSNILDDLKNPNFNYIVAKVDNMIVGFATFLAISEIEIECIVVKKEFQRMGIGTLLLEYIINTAKKRQIKNIFLEVRKSNISAISLYTKNKFEIISKRKNYYSDTGEDALILRREVD